MLVLTRRPDESIVIGDNIEVRVLGINGDKVRLGVQAPREIPVFREEVARSRQAEAAAREAGSAQLAGANDTGPAPEAQEPAANSAGDSQPRQTPGHPAGPAVDPTADPDLGPPEEPGANRAEAAAG